VLFLQVYWPIHAERERRLAADRSVDFEDMLVQAVGHLETGTRDAGYDPITVDEFQDPARAGVRKLPLPGRTVAGARARTSECDTLMALSVRMSHSPAALEPPCRDCVSAALAA
jgi:hypothetical protein